VLTPTEVFALAIHKAPFSAHQLSGSCGGKSPIGVACSHICLVWLAHGDSGVSRTFWPTDRDARSIEAGHTWHGQACFRREFAALSQRPHAAMGLHVVTCEQSYVVIAKQALASKQAGGAGVSPFAQLLL
jgi:hypothetical protein